MDEHFSEECHSFYIFHSLCAFHDKFRIIFYHPFYHLVKEILRLKVRWQFLRRLICFIVLGFK